jgi:hypothetical protein
MKKGTCLPARSKQDEMMDVKRIVTLEGITPKPSWSVMVKRRMAEILALASLVVAVAIYALGQGTDILTDFAVYGIIGYMGAAALVGIFVYLRIGRSKFSSVVLGYAVGLLSWAVGLSIYAYAYYVTNIGLPYVSVADAFYLLSYPPWMISALGMLRVFAGAIGRRTRLSVLAAGATLYVLVGAFVVPSSVSGLNNALDVFVTVLYPTLDIAFFLMVLALFLAFRKGVFEKPFGFMALGTMLLALGDVTYAVVSSMNLYYDGTPIDLMLFFGCVTAGYGFWRQYADLRRLL